MDKYNKHKAHIISDILMKVPTIGSTYKGNKVIKASRVMGNDRICIDTYYKIVTIGKRRKKKHYFIMILPEYQQTLGRASGHAITTNLELNKLILQKSQ